MRVKSPRFVFEKKTGNFDDFINHKSAYWTLQLSADVNENNWLEYGRNSFDCPSYSKSYKYKHIVYIKSF